MTRDEITRDEMTGDEMTRDEMTGDEITRSPFKILNIIKSLLIYQKISSKNRYPLYCIIFFIYFFFHE
jgi:hypothetical protein